MQLPSLPHCLRTQKYNAEEVGPTTTEALPQGSCRQRKHVCGAPPFMQTYLRQKMSHSVATAP